jgi:hypothetical protein
MNISKGAVLCAALSVLAACGSNNNLPYPRATMFPGTEQQKLQSASHWEVLAQYESEQILSGFGEAEAGTRPLFLNSPSENPAPFERAYHSLLTSALVGAGADVMLSPEDALMNIHYDVQVIEHDSREGLPARPGTYTAFFVAVAGLGDTQYWTHQHLALIPVAMTVDLWNNFRKDTKAEVTEVIITTRVQDSRQITHSDSRVYYFNPEDIAHYRDQGRTFNVVTAGGN